MKIKKIILTLLILFYPLTIIADGMIIKGGPMAGDYQRQSQQEGVIKYERGVQGMILSVDIEGADEDMVWIFPVPSLPDNVEVDISTKRPTLDGKDLSIVSQELIKDSWTFLYASQLWPVVFDRIFVSPESLYDDVYWEGDLDIGRSYDVEVHKHLEKEGMTLELLTSEHAEDLYNYLADHDLELEEKAKSLFDYYIGEEYSFVASWISSPEEIGIGEERGILMQFPSEDIFYPLLLTSIYDQQRIPISVVVLNYGNPQVFWDIKNYTEVNHYIASQVTGLSRNSNFEAGVGIPKEHENFLGSEEDVRGYTRININAPAKYFTRDLLINPRTPFLVSLFHFYSANSILSFIALFLFISVVSGVAVSTVLFKNKLSIKERAKRGMKLGALNIFSLLGTIIGTIILKESWKSKLLFIIFFTTVFLFFSVGILALLDIATKTIN